MNSLERLGPAVQPAGAKDGCGDHGRGEPHNTTRPWWFRPVPSTHHRLTPPQRRGPCCSLQTCVVLAVPARPLALAREHVGLWTPRCSHLRATKPASSPQGSCVEHSPSHTRPRRHARPTRVGRSPRVGAGGCWARSCVRVFYRPDEPRCGGGVGCGGARGGPRRRRAAGGFPLVASCAASPPPPRPPTTPPHGRRAPAPPAPQTWSAASAPCPPR